MGEAGNWPGGVKVVAEWFPVRERALASGIFNSGSANGAIISPPLVVWIVLKLGWRAAFFIVGATGFAWLAIWLLTYVTPAMLPDQQVNPSLRLSQKQLFSTRSVWAFILSKIFLDTVWYFYIFWFPAYLKGTRHFDLVAIGKYAWIPFLVAGAGNILGGWVVAALLRYGVNLSVARKLSVTIFACLMGLTIPAVLVGDVRASITLVSLAMLGYTGVLANMLAMPADVFPPNVLASVCRHGLGLRRNGVCPNHRLAGRSLFLRARLYRFWPDASYRGNHYLDIARTSSPAASTASAGNWILSRSEVTGLDDSLGHPAPLTFVGTMKPNGFIHLPSSSTERTSQRSVGSLFPPAVWDRTPHMHLAELARMLN